MMKRFKFLGALFVGLIGLVGFGYCGFENNFTTGFVLTTSQNGNNFFAYDSSWIKIVPINGSITVNGVTCLYIRSTGTNPNSYLQASCGGSNYNERITSFTFGAGTYGFECYDSTHNCTSTSIDFGGQTFSFTNVLGGSDCPSQYTSEECQQEYSLMPISSCNSEYCGLNGLCPEYTGSTMSELYINGINHLGAPIINISIPLEQAWDYEYTGDVMNINLSGENNVDYEYMDNIIRTQNSKPNTVDFNNIISVLLPKFIPGLVILLFILFVFRFIKKIF